MWAALASVKAYVRQVRPVPSAEPVARLDYVARGASGAFLEIVKIPGPPATPGADAGASAPKSEYLVRTERTRLWAKVLASVAEQVDQDVPSIVK